MSSDSKVIVLKSYDGEVFEVSQAVALQSQTIAHRIEDNCVDNGVPISNVTGKTLAKVIEYCMKHVADDSTEEELKTWDADYMKIKLEELFELILAANFLNIKDLLDLTCQTVADMIKDKTPEQIRTSLTSKTISQKKKK